MGASFTGDHLQGSVLNQGSINAGGSVHFGRVSEPF